MEHWQTYVILALLCFLVVAVVQILEQRARIQELEDE
jgi:fucose permease